MRRARSSLATTSSTPSSVFLRPSFHWSNTRVAYCSMVSGAVVGTIRTATWAPLRCSSAASRCSRAWRRAASSVPVVSVTRACKAGTAAGGAGWAPAGAPASRPSASNSRPASHMRTPRRGTACRLLGRLGSTCIIAETNFRRPGNGRLVGDAEIGFRGIAEDLGGDHARELAHQHVVCLDRLHVATARHRNTVLGAFELHLQVAEQAIGLELRVVLGHRDQARQGGRELALSLLEALHGGR